MVKCKPSSRISLRDVSYSYINFFSTISIAASRVSPIFLCLISYYINFLVPSNLVTIYTVSLLHEYVHFPTMDEILYIHVFPSKHCPLGDLGPNPLVLHGHRQPLSLVFCYRSAEEPFPPTDLWFFLRQDNRWNTG